MDTSKGDGDEDEDDAGPAVAGAAVDVADGCGCGVRGRVVARLGVASMSMPISTLDPLAETIISIRSSSSSVLRSTCLWMPPAPPPAPCVGIGKGISLGSGK